MGRSALWAEVADEFALTALHQPDLRGDAAVADRLQLALRTPTAPWRKVPQLWLTEHRGESTYVGRKGGCCLAYQCVEVSGAEEPVTEVDARLHAWQQRFPTPTGAPEYCSTCSLREGDDCVERQLFWLDQERTDRRP